MNTIITLHKEEEKFNSVLSFSYVWITILYLLFGITGALMYGDGTLPSIIQNLHTTLNSKTRFIGTVVSWIIIIVPITKFALLMDPVAFSVTQFINSKFLEIKKKKQFNIQQY